MLPLPRPRLAGGQMQFQAQAINHQRLAQDGSEELSQIYTRNALEQEVLNLRELVKATQDGAQFEVKIIFKLIVIQVNFIADRWS